jgi:hypothetical protein
MKKLNLDETWRLCLSMRRWIAKKMRKNDTLDVDDLKYSWLYSHTKDKPENECYFCERNKQMGGVSLLDECGDCRYCPPREIDKDFTCNNPDYHYYQKPIAFYNKLRSLNRKRLAKK